MAKPRDSFSCPVCGEDVPAGALACPECGACDKSGWNEDSYLDGVDLPGGDQDEDGEKEKEGTGPAGPRNGGMGLIAAGLVLAFLWPLLRGCGH